MGSTSPPDSPLLEPSLASAIGSVVRLAAETTHCTFAELCFPDADRIVSAITQGLSPGERPRAQDPCEPLFDSGLPAELADGDPRLLALAHAIGIPELHLHAAVPVLDPDGRPIAALAVFDPAPPSPGSSPLATLKALADVVAAHLSLEQLHHTGTPGGERTADAELAANWTQLPVPALRLDPGGRIAHPNRELLVQVGMTLEELTGRELAVIVAPADALRVRGDRPERGIACQLLRKDGTRLEVLAHKGPLEEGCVVSFTPVRAAQEALREAHRRTRNILESISDGFVALDRDWRYTFVNHRAAAMFGRDPEELLGKNIWETFPQAVGQPFHRAYVRALEEQVPLSIEAYSVPWKRWFSNRIYPSPDGLTIFFTEITDRRRIDEEVRASRDRLRALSAQLQAVRERDHTRIAKEIHDQLGQALIALDLGLASLAHRLADGAGTAGHPVAPELAHLRALIRGAIDAEGRIAAELRPAILDELGLGAALGWYADEYAQRTGVACRVRDQAQDVTPSRDASTALFRIFQEALDDVARRGGAHRIDASLARNGSALVLEIEDDSSSAEETDGRAASLRLLGMQERAAAVGGEIRVGPRPGGGTRVVARVALTPSDKG